MYVKKFLEGISQRHMGITVFVQIFDRTNVRPFQDFFLEVRPFLRSNIFTITVFE